MEGDRRAGMPQPGLYVETVQEAKEDISRRWEREGSETSLVA